MPNTTNNSWPTPSDSDPFKAGAQAIRDLGNGIDSSVGNGFKAWIAYTPTLTGFNIGTTGSTDFKYVQIGKTVHVRGYILFGGTGISVPGASDMTLPVTSSTYNLGHPIGQFMAYNNSTLATGQVISIGSTSTYRLHVTNTAGAYASSIDLSPSVPFTWAATHKMFVSLTYQAA